MLFCKLREARLLELPSHGDPATVAGMEKETITTIKIGYLNHKVMYVLHTYACIYLSLNTLFSHPYAKMLEYVWDGAHQAS